MPTKTLINGHKSFKSDFKKNEKLFLNLAQKGQRPKTLWIGCSDSRVIPEQIMGTEPGEIFVHRNIANIIPPKNSNESCTASVVEYAINALKIEHIVICGHTECGGIKAILGNSDSKDETAINKWLKHALPAKEKVSTKNPHAENIYIDTIKENILLQKDHLLSYDYINAQYQAGKINIHCWLYDLHQGEISFFNSENETWERLI
ncbi:carbonic anhydrase [Calditrichota bacterium]